MTHEDKLVEEMNIAFHAGALEIGSGVPFVERGIRTIIPLIQKDMLERMIKTAWESDEDVFRDWGACTEARQLWNWLHEYAATQHGIEIE